MIRLPPISTLFPYTTLFRSLSTVSSAHGVTPGGTLLHQLGQGRFEVSVPLDRKSTRLNSSHSQISYAVFCLKKKKPTACLYHSYPRRAPTHSPRKSHSHLSS